MTRRATVLAWRTLVWVLLAGIVLLLLATVVVPRLGGATGYDVLSGSMKPTLPPGTLVVVRPSTIDDLRLGDVVTFQKESGRPEVVTHRVVGFGTAADGTSRVLTQGDANDAPDPLVEAGQLRGRLWYAVPHVGTLTSTAAGSREAAAGAVALALIAYSAFMAVGAVRDRHRSRARDPEHASIPDPQETAQ